MRFSALPVIAALGIVFLALTPQAATANQSVDPGGMIIDITGDPTRDEVYASLDTDEVVRVFMGSAVVTGRITLPGTAGPIAISSDGTKLFAALQDSYSIAVYQIPGLIYQGTFVTSSTSTFDDLVAGSDRLYAASSDNLSIIDTTSGTELYWGDPDFYDFVLRLSPDESTLFALNTDVSPASVFGYDVSTDVPLQVNEDCCHGCIGSGGRSMAFSPDGQTLYLAASPYRVQVLNRQATGLLNEEHRILLDDNPIALGLSPDGATLYIGHWDNQIVIADTASQLVYRVEPTLGVVKRDGIVVAPSGYDVAVAVQTSSSSSLIEFIDVTLPMANRGGVTLRPLDNIDGIPVSAAYEDNLTFYGSSGFIDVKNGVLARNPIEPGTYDIEIKAYGYDTVSRQVTVFPGQWTDLGDVTMTRTGDLAAPNSICAEPAIIGIEPTPITIHGKSFHPDAIVTPNGTSYAIHSYTWLDWSTIEATVSSTTFSTWTGQRLALNVTNPDGESGWGYLFYITGEMAILGFDTGSLTVPESSGTVDLEVYRTGSTGGEVSVDYTTLAGTATPGADYTTSSGTLTWPAGDGNPKTISVPIAADTEPEGPETFTVRITNPSTGAALGDITEVEVTIEDDDSSTIRFAVADVDVDEGSGSVSLTVSRSGDTSDAASVGWATASGTATAGSDFTSTGGTVDWPAGDSDDKTIEVVILDDAYPEVDETFTVNLSSPSGNAYIGEPSMATVTIHSDDVTEVVFSSATYADPEGVGTAVVTVTRTGTFNGAITVGYTTGDGSASAGSDYVPAADTLSWADGDGAPKTFDVTILDDDNVEPDETVLLTLGNPTGGATIGAVGSAELTIEDDDGSLLRFATAAINTSETDISVDVTVERLGGDTSGAVAIDFATTDGTATSGLDYVATSGNLSWADGETDDKSFSVTILDDGLFEGFETVNLELTNPTGNATLGNPASAVIAIADDEWVEQLVNTETDQPQTRPDAAMNASGESIVVWESYLQDGGGWGIFGQRFDADGVPVGVEFQVNSGSAGDQRYPAAAMRADGSFTVVWVDADGAGSGIRGRSFNAAGAPVGPDFTVNTTTAGDQTEPDLAVDSSGAGIVVWQSDAVGDLEIRGRLLGGTGAPTGSELALNSTTAGDQQRPAVAGRPAGGFVAAWQGYGQDGPADGIIVRLLTAGGAPAGAEVVANQWTSGNQISPAVAAAADGSFLVAWEDTTNKDGSGSSIRARWFDSVAAPLGGDIQANTYWLDDQMNPTVACAGPGDARIAWESENQDGSNLGIYTQAVGHDGTFSGVEQRMNTYVLGIQYRPAAAGSASGAFWAVWASGAQDGSGDGVYGLFSAAPVVPWIFADGFESGDTSGWGVTAP